MRHSGSAGLMAGIILLCGIASAATENSQPPVNPASFQNKSLSIDEAFREHRRQRAELVQAIDDTKASLDTLRNSIAAKESELARLKTDLDGLVNLEEDEQRVEGWKTYRSEQQDKLKLQEERLRTSNAADRQRLNQDIEAIRRDIERTDTDISRWQSSINRDKKRRDTLQGDMQKRLDELKKHREEESKLIVQLKDNVKKQSALEDEIAQILTPESQRNTFKTLIASAFALLVAFVIFGFFAVAWRDEVVRRTIFSSDSGIQFLTLFSLVIAIILFGITGILESKELAAMLGGLSGYILGRANSRPQDSPRAQPPARVQDAPVQPQPI